MVLSLLWATKGQAQSFAGKDFWFAFITNTPENFTVAPPDTVTLQVHIVSENGATATLTAPMGSWTKTVSIPAGSFTTVTLPRSVFSNQGLLDGVVNTGVHLVATDDCIVYIGNYLPFSSDAATLIPTSSLTKFYHVVTYAESSPAVSAATGSSSSLIVVATENNTKVDVQLAKTTQTNRVRGSTVTYTLNAGQAVHLTASGVIPIVPPSTTPDIDLTGTVVNSDKPVAVFGGNPCSYVGNCLACDHLFEEIRPINTWSYEFYGAASCKGSTGISDIVRIYAPQAGTNISFNGSAQTLGAGTFVDIDAIAGFYVTSNNPIYVSQFLRGSTCSVPAFAIDPLMLDVLGQEQYASKYIFATSPFPRYGEHYATIVVPTAQTGSIRINGNIPVLAGSGLLPAGWQPVSPIAGVPYSYGYISLAIGTTYTATSTNNTPFGLYVYGYGLEEAYGYVAGGKLQDLCTVTAKDTFVCPGVNVTLKATSPFINNDGTVLQWYDTPTGGLPLFTGTDYNIGVVGAAKTYYVQVNNAGCSDKRKAIVVDLKPVPTATFDCPTAICANVNGTINYTGSAPDIASTTYAWNFGAGAVPASSTARGPISVNWSTISPPAKNVSLTVTQAGCAATISKPVTVNNSPTSLFTTDKTTYCLGDIATITYTGSGTATGSYDWNFLTDADVEIVSHPDYKTYTIKWKSKGAKNISLTPSDFGCSGALTTKSITVNELPALISSAVNTSTCTSTDGQASVVVTNVVSGVYTYSWNSTPVQTAATATGLGSGAYTVTVRDPAGCMNTATSLVIPGGSPVINTSGIQNVSCNGGNDGKITLRGTSGSLTSFDYTVKNKLGVIVIPTTNSGTSFTATGLKAGDYTFTVADASGCAAPGVFAITEPVKLIPNAGPDFPICPGETGTLTASALGGVAPYLYSNDNIVFAAVNTFNYAPAATTDYTLFVKDNNGCIASDVAAVVIKDGPAVGEISLPKNICITDTASISYPLGTSLDVFTWGFDFGDAPANPNEGPNLVSWKTTGTKTISLTVSRSGCTVKIPDTTIAVVPPPTVIITVDTNLVCANEPIQVSYQGNAPATAIYEWDFAGGVPATATGPGPFSVYWPTGSAKNINVDITVGKTCKSNRQASVLVKEIPASVPTTPIPFCQDNKTVKIAIPGAGPFVKWYTNPTGGVGTFSQPDQDLSVPGDFYYYASQTIDNCESQRNKIHVIVNPKDIVGFDFDKVGYCKNDVNQFPEAKLDPGFKQGGIFTCTSPGLKFKDNLKGIIDLAQSTAGNSLYRIKYKSTGKCFDSSTVNLRVYVVPTAGFKYDSTSYCKNEKNPVVTLTKGATAGTYTVSPSGLLKFANNEGTIDLAGSAAGDYTITNLVTSRDGCVAPAPNTAKVTIIGVPGSSFTLPTSTCINAGVIITTPDAKINTASYKWNFGDAIVKKQKSNTHGSNFEVLWNSYGQKTITYSVVDRGCSSPLTEKTIAIADLPIAHITSNPPPPVVLTIGDNPEIKFEATDVNGSLINAQSYMWDFGDGAKDNSAYTLHKYNAGVGNEATYLVKLVTSNGFNCETADSMMVNIVNKQGMKAPTIFTPNGDGNNERFRPVIVGARITSFQIFNRWGEMIYSADNNQEGWDGFHKNEAVPNGVYVFIVKGVALTDGNTELKPEYGIVTVVK